ncbi:MAG: SUMF1/EgtB/PvdO family nonheme iron enzyme [Burkholderiales bacterium]
MVASLASIAHGQSKPAVSARTGERVALVIGNDGYRHVEALRNARADARAIANALANTGFAVTLHFDADQSTMKAALRNFKSRIGGGDEAVFYYSGHGVQFGSENYLLPIDIRSESEDQIRDDAVPLQRVLDDLQDQKARFSLAIVDACRNNPFRRAGRAIGGRGLAKTTGATGQIVLYSAGAGQQALDQLGKNDKSPNGLFTRVFLREMEKPGVPVDRVLRNVREEVARLAKSVGHEQVPALYDQALGEFYFRPGNPSDARVATIGPAPVADPSTNDRALWEAVKDSRDPEELRAYIAQFPQGIFAGLARARLKSAEAAKPPPTQVASGVPAAPAATPQAPAPTPASSASLQSMQPGTVFRDCEGCPEMVVIPPGRFLMGSPASEEGRSNDEGPQHEVAIPRAIAVAKFEVTFAEWEACVAAGGCQHRPEDSGWGKANRPVINVSWNDAKEYVKWLSSKTSKAYRLLSEAEWEYAARAGSATPYPWGIHAGQNRANFYRSESQWSDKQTAPAGSFAPNKFGLHDMIGNVWEWTEDCRNGSYDGAPNDGSAWTSGNCGIRVLRGGSWNLPPRFARAAVRQGFVVTLQFNYIGFRVARTDF